MDSNNNNIFGNTPTMLGNLILTTIQLDFQMPFLERCIVRRSTMESILVVLL